MLVGIVVCLVYGVLLVGMQRLSGVPYTDFASSEPNLRKGALIPVAIGTAVLVVVLAATGRLAEAFTYAPRSGSVLLWALPIAFLLGVVLRLRRNDWTAVTRRFVFVALVTCLLVGFSEELLVRGYLVDVLQAQGLATIWVAIVSSLVFGVIHGLNALNGQDAQTTALQVALTTLMGLGLFASLAVSGTLWLPVLLHAFFDFSLLAQGKIHDVEANRTEVVLIGVTYLLSLGSLFLI